jgi:hypothetical protein
MNEVAILVAIAVRSEKWMMEKNIIDESPTV